jgi:hypothetical protein
MLFIVGITWASGLGYLSGVSALRGTGPLRMAELVRLVSSVLLPIAAVEAQRLSGAPKWMVITLVSAEMAHGGLDNLLAHHHVEQGALGWGLRLGTELGLLVAMLVLPGSAALAGGAAAGVSVAGLVWAFATRRSYYLGPKGDKLRSVVSSGPGEAPSEGG